MTTDISASRHITKYEIAILAILAIYSCIQYAYAPLSYSSEYCIHLLVIFLIVAIIVIRRCYNQVHTIFNFDTLFAVSFFYTNYVYGAFLYITNPHFSLFRLDFNDAYICKGIALTTVGYCWYAIGRCIILKRKSIDKDFTIDSVRFEKIKKLTFFLALILSFIVLPFIGSNYEGGLPFGTIGNQLCNTTFILVYYVIIVLFQKYCSVKTLFQHNKKLCFIILFLMFSLLLIGSRTLPMRLMLLVAFLFNIYVNPIKTKTFLFLGSIGFFLMFYIGSMRLGYETESISDNPFINAGNELIINNRSLYVLMDYADHNGYTLGKTLLMNILSILPFFQSLFLSLTGWTNKDIGSAYLVTDLYFSERNDDVIGLGTNLIGDIYLCYGVIGVIIMMFIFGKVINRLCYGTNRKSIIIYALFIMNAVYYARSGILTPTREICWILFVDYYCKKRIE